MYHLFGFLLHPSVLGKKESAAITPLCGMYVALPTLVLSLSLLHVNHTHVLHVACWKDSSSYVGIMALIEQRKPIEKAFVQDL